MDDDEPSLFEEASRGFKAAKAVRDFVWVALGIATVVALGLDWVLRQIMP